MSANTLVFEVGDYVVYPKHGVGRVIELQKSEIAGMQLELYVLRFEKEKTTLRVPTNKAEGVGMRKLSSDKTLKEARSEEHTSELQSLMRISYAVFCLKKKKKRREKRVSREE